MDARTIAVNQVWETRRTRNAGRQVRISYVSDDRQRLKVKSATRSNAEWISTAHLLKEYRLVTNEEAS